MTTEDAQRRVHEAIGGEFAMSWVLTIDVAGPENTRYLAHRAGGGADGTDHPMMWAALGMLRASAQVAERQLADATGDPDEEDE